MSVFKTGRPVTGLVRRADSRAHLILAAAVMVSGIWLMFPLLYGVFTGERFGWFGEQSWREMIDAVGLFRLPRVVIAISLILMSFGLLARARVAWAFSLVLLFPAIVVTLYLHDWLVAPLDIYNVLLIAALLRYWSAFNRSSLAASTLFAFASFFSLLWYAVLGVLYLGHEFSPKILTLPDAIYFSFVAMATVGFGDIVPVTPTSRLFVISIILLGVTVFASALGAVIAPFLTGTLRQIIQRNARRSMRRNHVILCGATPLAMNLYSSLVSRGEHVTVIVRPETVHEYPATADIVVGDGSSDEVLRTAGVLYANYVLALREDDPDNAFIVLAVKSFAGCNAKTVAIVNNNQNLEKIRRVKPDLLFSPQLFGAELLSRIMLGEKFDADLIAELFIAKPLTVSEPEADDAPATSANAPTTATTQTS